MVGETHCVARWEVRTVPGVGVGVGVNGNTLKGVILARGWGDVKVAAEEEDMIM